MNEDIQRIGTGNVKSPDINTEVLTPVPGVFTFDSTVVTFDSDVDTFDFDITPFIP